MKSSGLDWRMEAEMRLKQFFERYPSAKAYMDYPDGYQEAIYRELPLHVSRGLKDKEVFQKLFHAHTKAMPIYQRTAYNQVNVALIKQRLRNPSGLMPKKVELIIVRPTEWSWAQNIPINKLLKMFPLYRKRFQELYYISGLVLDHTATNEDVYKLRITLRDEDNIRAIQEDARRVKDMLIQLDDRPYTMLDLQTDLFDELPTVEQRIKQIKKLAKIWNRVDGQYYDIYNGYGTEEARNDGWISPYSNEGSVNFNGFVFTPLCTPGELKKEGEEMDHCVGSYTDRCLDIKPAHVYKIEGPNVRATMELYEYKEGEFEISQLYGERNMTVRDDALDYAIELFMTSIDYHRYNHIDARTRRERLSNEIRTTYPMEAFEFLCEHIPELKDVEDTYNDDFDEDDFEPEFEHDEF